MSEESYVASTKRKNAKLFAPNVELIEITPANLESVLRQAFRAGKLEGNDNIFKDLFGGEGGGRFRN